MEVKLQKWGNSLGIRIPKILLQEISLDENDLVNLSIDEDKIIVSKSNNKKISLKERFSKYQGDNLSKEFEWDEPRGNELW